MALNRWRCVRYTDDGCSEYQCLSCYKTWEGRTSPEYSQWKHCPYCGTQWEGQQNCLHTGEKYYSLPRWSESRWPKPSSYWIIEKRTHSGYEWSEWTAWQQERVLDGRWKAKEIHEMLRDLRAWANHDHKQYGTSTEYRVSIVKTLPYPNCHVWHWRGN